MPEENKENNKEKNVVERETKFWIIFFIFCMLISALLFFAIRMGINFKTREQLAQNTLYKVKNLSSKNEVSVRSIGNLLVPRAFHKSLAVVPDKLSGIPSDYTYPTDKPNKVLIVGGVYKNILVKNAEIFDIETSQSVLIPGSKLNNLTSTLVYGVNQSIYAVNSVPSLKSKNYGIEKYDVNKFSVEQVASNLMPRVSSLDLKTNPSLKSGKVYIYDGNLFEKGNTRVEVIDNYTMKDKVFDFDADIKGGSFASDEFGKIYLFGGFDKKNKQISRDIYLLKNDFSDMTKVGILSMPMITPNVYKLTQSDKDDAYNASEWLVINDHLGNIIINLVDSTTYSVSKVIIPSYLQKNKLNFVQVNSDKAYLFFQKNNLVHVVLIQYGKNEIEPIAKFESVCTAQNYTALFTKSDMVKTFVSGGVKYEPKSNLGTNSDVCSEVKLIEIKSK